MKRKTMLLFAALVLFQTCISGCGERKGADRAIPAESFGVIPGGTDAADADAPQSSVENTGIVNDTVVDVFREPTPQSERVTQALFNQPVIILAEEESWINVKVVDGYTGWIKNKYIDKDTSEKTVTVKQRAVVTAKNKKLLTSPKNGITIKDIVLGTELGVISQDNGWYEVALPGGKNGWMEMSGTIMLPVSAHIPKTTATDFIMTAEKLRGSTYLWGGVSSLGIDCSGLTYICSRINGVDLPRDADQQYNVGEAVSLDKVMEGDLLFFSTNEDLADISHVGIYSGNGQFIHASKSKGAVTTSSISETYFQTRLVGIKRLFN